ncbi:MAG: protease pro-enzyme activation domain-containing protein, partial [Bryobacteraceae bacterium]
MADGRVILPGSDRGKPAGCEETGEADAQQNVRLTVVVRRIAPIPPDAYLHPVSREEFQRRYGAHRADIEKVEKFAASRGLHVESADIASRNVVLTGTLGAASAAFGAQVRRYQGERGTFRARSGQLTLPAELDGVVEGVFGFDERPQARTHHRVRVRQAAKSTDVSYTPNQIAAAYSFPQGVNGAGQTIGIVELGGGYETADLDGY